MLSTNSIFTLYNITVIVYYNKFYLFDYYKKYIKIIRYSFLYT